MRLRLKIWRQEGPGRPGRLVRYELDDVSPDSSFLEMLDLLNERLVEKGEQPVVFGHDCREGVCGSCGVMINGQAHGPDARTATCQLHMRGYSDGDTIQVEPWRSRAYPVLKDLIVDRGALDRLMPLVYDELRRVARRHMAGERRDHTLQPTALGHEAFGRQ